MSTSNAMWHPAFDASGSLFPRPDATGYHCFQDDEAAPPASHTNVKMEDNNPRSQEGLVTWFPPRVLRSVMDNVEHNDTRYRPAAAAPPEPPTKSGRGNASLLTIAPKFVERSARAGGVLDLAVAAEELGVPKRRMYDIANVLEGTGLVERYSKSKIRWKEDAKKYLSTRGIMDDLLAVERAKDREIERIRAELTELSANPEYYVSEADARRLFGDEQLLVAHFPAGTSCEIPEGEPTTLKLMAPANASPHGGITLSRLDATPQPTPEPAATPRADAIGVAMTIPMPLTTPPHGSTPKPDGKENASVAGTFSFPVDLVFTPEGSTGGKKAEWGKAYLDHCLDWRSPAIAAQCAAGGGLVHDNVDAWLEQSNCSAPLSLVSEIFDDIQELHFDRELFVTLGV